MVTITTNKEETADFKMNHDEHENGTPPLFDEDPALDFLLYEEMHKENKPRSQAGCLGVVIFCFVIPAGWLAHHWL